VKTELVINLKTAKALCLTIPQSLLHQRGQLLRAALGFAGLPRPYYDRALWTLRTWLDSWAGIGRLAVGMAHQGFDLQLTRYDERGWRATFYTTGMALAAERDRHRMGAHAVACATQRAAWEALGGCPPRHGFSESPLLLE
jgi:hypothetical protein